jgi:hypothetical protein
LDPKGEDLVFLSKFLLLPTTRFFVAPLLRMTLRGYLIFSVILSPSASLGTCGAAKDPHDEAFEVVES